MIVRRRIRYDGKEVISDNAADIDWHELRITREAELIRTDIWALQDRQMSDEQIDYRTFLRELPQNFPDSANAAADAWNEYILPEGA
jgi:hypothetical protein